MISLDVLMPGMDGWTVLRALKADPLTASIPVVMVSMLDDRDIGYALGAADYLTKPFDREKLVARAAPLPPRRARRGRCWWWRTTRPRARWSRRALERDGWSVTEADNGRRGLRERARATCPT